MKNNQAQEEGTKILQRLHIENDKIRCTYRCVLQALIAYVKPLIQLFPQVKENVKLALSSHEILKCFYRDETMRYVEQLKENSLYFEADPLCLGNFLNSEEKSTSATNG